MKKTYQTPAFELVELEATLILLDTGGEEPDTPGIGGVTDEFN